MVELAGSIEKSCNTKDLHGSANSFVLKQANDASQACGGLFALNRNYHEDCLETMARMPDAFLDAIITDPPYGISYQSARRTDRTQWKAKLANDDKPCTEFLPDAYRVLKDQTPLIVFCEWRFQEVFRQAIIDAGFNIKSHVIWDREWHGMGDLTGSFAPSHDIVWFATKGRYLFPFHRPTSVLRFPRVAADALEHPTQKPVDLIAYLIKTLTQEGDIIYDPFMGSGTLAVAANRLKRQWIGSEISSEYVELANKRLEPYLAQEQLF